MRRGDNLCSQPVKASINWAFWRRGLNGRTDWWEREVSGTWMFLGLSLGGSFLGNFWWSNLSKMQICFLLQILQGSVALREKCKYLTGLNTISFAFSSCHFAWTIENLTEKCYLLSRFCALANALLESLACYAFLCLPLTRTHPLPFIFLAWDLCTHNLCMPAVLTFSVGWPTSQLLVLAEVLWWMNKGMTQMRLWMDRVIAKI